MLDELDISILRELQENARTPYTKIAEKLGVDDTTVRSRIKRLEQRGVITGYSCVINLEHVGAIPGFIHLRLGEDPSSFLEFMKGYSGLGTLSQTVGSYGFFARVHASGIEDFCNLIEDLRSRFDIVYLDYALSLRGPKLGAIASPETFDNLVSRFGEYMRSRGFDELDLKIVRLLLEDSRRTFTSLGEILGVDSTTVRNRIRKLEESEFIKRYVALLDISKLGLSVCYLTLKIAGNPRSLLETLSRMRGSTIVVPVFGTYDIFSRFLLRRLEDLSQIEMEVSRQAKHIEKFNISIVSKPIVAPGYVPPEAIESVLKGSE